jgi:hypothetical protein
MVVAAFVAPYLLEATARFALSAARVPGVRLGLVTTASADNLSLDLRDALADHWQVADALDPSRSPTPSGASAVGSVRSSGRSAPWRTAGAAGPGTRENTALVRAALDRIISELRVELVEAE